MGAPERAREHQRQLSDTRGIACLRHGGTSHARRNINYTNRCTYACGFCAFSKGRIAEELRGAPYLLPLSEVTRRTAEAWDRGASEVCMQGGIHPDFTGVCLCVPFLHQGDVFTSSCDALPFFHAVRGCCVACSQGMPL